MIMLLRSSIFYLGKYSFKKFFSFILIIILLSAIYITFINFSIFSYKSSKKNLLRNLSNKNIIKLIETVINSTNMSVAMKRNRRCSYYSCFNPYRCGNNGESQIQIYVYPLKQFVTENGTSIIFHLSKEFHNLILAVKQSKYYVSNPAEACLFLPPIDTLSQDNFRIKETSQILNSLPYWNNGENHIIFNLIPPRDNSVINLTTGNAIIAGASFNSWTYRPSFDVSLPTFVPNISLCCSYTKNRSWLIVSSQLNIHVEFINKLKILRSKDSHLIILERCPNFNISFRCYNKMHYRYPEILQRSSFCLVFRGTRLAQPVLLEAMASGCIPVILSDTLVMPFHEIIDWKRAVLFILEDNISSVIEIVKSISPDRINDMSEQCIWLFKKYFSSIEVITNTTLDILNQRVFPENAYFYEDWNLMPNFVGAKTPLLLHTKSYSETFTAVILTYDRVESLFSLLERLSTVPSLSLILVIWNNPRKSPPKSSKWPKINKQLKIIRTNSNKLSNRFFPYKEIESEAVLSLDDDILMLTDDELDFGFEVWREFPDRIVGFPSRIHKWNNVTHSWKYESEWTNEISMILTGAAFYHKYWNYLFTKSLPSKIKDWIDIHMNCEDIAMNFLVTNITNKAPIKVTPRKKFKCPECTNKEMLSSDLNHMMQRSECINEFSKIYGRIPLKKVEFRADPVLFKDNFPSNLKKFKNVGDL